MNADLVIGELSANRPVPVVVLDDPADANRLGRRLARWRIGVPK